MTNIRFVSTRCIKPASTYYENKYYSHRIELNPCDLRQLLTAPIQKGLIFHNTQVDLHCSLVQHLKASLSNTLDIFYPLAGRLAMVKNDNDDTSTTSFFINCNAAGALFVHAAAEGVAVSDILKLVNVPEDVVFSFFPMSGILNHEGVSKPLLAVQVTELMDGFFVACTMNHAVADGTSFWHFFNTWSAISCGRPPPPPPSFGRQYLDGVVDSLPIRIPSFQGEIPFSIATSSPKLLRKSVLYFSKERIQELKAKANAEMNTNKISSLQALMGHLWISITRNRRLSPDQEVSYGLAIGLRRRFEPPLPEYYFGNAFLFRMVKSTAAEVLRSGLGWAAWQLNQMIGSPKAAAAEARKFFEEWARSPKLKKLGGQPSNMLLAGSSTRFDVYGNDFGWGKPVGVRGGPEYKYDGKLVVFPGAEEGTIAFEVCLSHETLEAMDNDREFMRTLGT